MKYIFLLLILFLLGTGLYYANKQYDHLTLITDVWEIKKEEITNGNFIVSIKDDGTNYYAFSTTNGFVNMAKELWLIGSLFVGLIVLLMPLSIYLFKIFWNQKLSDAKQSVIDANAKAEKAKMDSLDRINMIHEHCDSKIERAYKEQLNVVQKKLSEQLEMLEYREKYITGKELVAENTKREAENALSQYKAEFQKLKSDFEEKEKLLTKSRDNAVAMMQRKKIKNGGSYNVTIECT